MVVNMLRYIVNRVVKRNLDSTDVNLDSSHIIPSLSARCRKRTKPLFIQVGWRVIGTDHHLVVTSYHIHTAAASYTVHPLQLGGACRRMHNYHRPGGTPRASTTLM